MAVKNTMHKWLAILAFTPLVGCASLQDMHYECSQKMRTMCAYWDFKCTSEEPVSGDYAKGWRAGYFDVLTGGDGEPPVVAPRCYWSPSHRMKYGDQPRNDWYVGFQDGAMMASLEPDTHYIKTWNPPPQFDDAGYVPMSSSQVQQQATPAKVPPSEAPGLAPLNETQSDAGWEAKGSSTPPNLPPVPARPELFEQ